MLFLIFSGINMTVHLCLFSFFWLFFSYLNAFVVVFAFFLWFSLSECFCGGFCCSFHARKFEADMFDTMVLLS